MKNLLIFSLTLFCFISSNSFSQNIICEKTGFTCPEVNVDEIIEKDGFYGKKFRQNKQLSDN